MSRDEVIYIKDFFIRLSDFVRVLDQEPGVMSGEEKKSPRRGIEPRSPA